MILAAINSISPFSAEIFCNVKILLQEGRYCKSEVLQGRFVYINILKKLIFIMYHKVVNKCEIKSRAKKSSRNYRFHDKFETDGFKAKK